MISIPTALNSDGKIAMDTDASDPTRKADLERLNDEKVKQTNIDILL